MTNRKSAHPPEPGPRPPRRRARALWIVVETKPDSLLIKDVGHNQGMPTITNDVEAVVATLVEDGTLGARRLWYVDSQGDTDEILVRNGAFAGFGI